MKEMHKKNMYKAIVAFAVALAFIAPTSAVFANVGDNPTDPKPLGVSNTVVSISPSTQTVEKGQSFSVSVYVEPTELIVGATMGLLSFDHTLVQADLVTEADLFDNYEMFNDGTIDNGAGTITNVFILALVGDAVSDPGSFITIDFTALTTLGTSDLDLDGMIVASAGGVSLPLDVNDGTVTIEEYFVLTIDVVGEGTTTPSEGVHSYASGTVVELEAFYDWCWEFAGWSGDTVDPAMRPIVDEDFEGTFLPTGWTMTVGAFPPGQGGWKRNDQYGQLNYAGGDGFSACAHTLGCSGFMTNKIMHTELISPVMDLSSESAAELSFTASFKISPTTQIDYAKVEISADNGGMWTTILYWSGTEHDPTGPGEDVVIDLTSYVGNSQVILKWVYDAKWNHLTGVPGHFQIDDVKVSVPDPHLGTITMDADKTITATFTEIYYDLDISAVGDGTTTPAPGVYSYLCGTVVDLEALPDPGWEFVDWSGDLVSSNPSETITMDADKTITATFTVIYHDLTIIVDGCGTTTPAEGVHSYAWGTDVPVEAFECLNWAFTEWTGDLVSTFNPDSILMTSDKTITAVFKEGWTATLNIEASISSPYNLDWVVFGESAIASDGIDDFDLPKPGAPPAPYLYAWLDTDLAYPYDILWHDFRYYPADEQIWDLWIETEGTGPYTTTTMTWSTAEIIASGYDYVGLYEMISGNLVADMKSVGTYVYLSDHGMAQYFQIRCSNNHAPVANDDFYTTNENTVLTVTAPGVLWNDDDPEGDSIWVTGVISGPSDGIVDIFADGHFVYTPDVGFSGTDSFVYEITDGEFSDTATVFIDVLTLNRISIKDRWNLISMPVGEDIDRDDIIVEYLGTEYSWQEAISAHLVLGGFTYGWQAGMYNNEELLVPGEGYWLWSYVDCDLLIPSSAPGDNHVTLLDVEWNLVGVPYGTDVSKTSLRVQFEGIWRYWDTAVGMGVILDFVYDWDRDNQWYDISDDPNTFATGYGYWVYAYEGCALKKV